jgi:hypothetical protein
MNDNNAIEQCSTCRHVKETRTFDDKRLFSCWKCTELGEYVDANDVCIAYEPRIEEDDDAPV